MSAANGVRSGTARDAASVDGSGVDAGRWCEREAQLLLQAERDRAPVEQLSRRRQGLTLQEAYWVQRFGVALRVRAGARVMGHKVGLTSVAMQQQMGIAEPDSGVLLDNMAVPDGGVLRTAGLIAPRIEAEIAFRLGADLRGRAVDDIAAWDAVEWVCLALEVIDSRYPLAGITGADSVADNAACARFVLGPAVARPGWDLPAEELTLCLGGERVADGAARAVLGNPIRSVAWLARRLAEFGTGLSAGDVVLAGAVHASVELRRGDIVTASSSHLSEVSLRVG